MAKYIDQVKTSYKVWIYLRAILPYNKLIHTVNSFILKMIKLKRWYLLDSKGSDNRE